MMSAFAPDPTYTNPNLGWNCQRDPGNADGTVTGTFIVGAALYVPGKITAANLGFLSYPAAPAQLLARPGLCRPGLASPGNGAA